MTEPIAIVGMSCRFPGAPDLVSFWDLLRAGRDGVSDIPASRWDADAWYDRDPNAPGRTINRRGGFIEDVEGFDWRAFRISPREAKYMDPQHRLVLELAWEALDDAGLAQASVAGTNAGVYIGIMWKEYLGRQVEDRTQLTGFSATGNVFAFAPGRISYVFDLRGPSIAIDCACAASLASVHAACQGLWLGETALALAGGVNLMLSPDANIMLSKAGVLSPDGRCKTLDAAADGFVRSEGAGLVVLKRLSDVSASDRVYALIRGSAMSHNGHNEWIMAASADGQQRALREAYRVAGVDPSDVDYVELHGTALPKGDPTEARSLGAVLNTSRRRAPCRVGSVKSNLGHLDSAAGIASLVKVALSLYHGELPPTIHLQTLNPQIPLAELGLTAQRSLEPWPAHGGPRYAGVTSISMAGVNQHVVLQGVAGADRSGGQVGTADSQAFVLTVSARSAAALRARAASMLAFLQGTGSPSPSLYDVCFTASTLRTHFEHRLALVAENRETMCERLRGFLTDQSSPDVFSSDAAQAGRAVLDDLAGLHALALRYVTGGDVDWGALFLAGGRCVSLPPYPWQRDRLWFANAREPQSRVPAGALPRDSHPDSADLRHVIERAPPHQRIDLLARHVRAMVAEILDADSREAIDNRQGLFDAGLNSIGATELAARLTAGTGRAIPATVIFEYPTVERLADYLARTVFGLRPAAAIPQPGAPRQAPLSADTLAGLSEEAAEALLLQQLKALE